MTAQPIAPSEADSPARSAVLQLRERVGQSVVGQRRMINRLIMALLADGHVLIEGLPGLAKTRAVKSLSQSLECQFSRIQFTPDLLPSDVTGGDIYHEATQSFEFREGPVFGNLILADEINRAPAKVQSALLEAMVERQVTVAGKRHKLPELFVVLATQNPIEQEGTYPLPEAQTDRFLMHVRVDYPSTDEERDVLTLVRGERAGRAGPQAAAIPQEEILAARAEVASIVPSAAIDAYILALIEATRRPAKFGDKLPRWIALGASPRGTLALDVCARAHAWLDGRDFVTPTDVQSVAPECLRHRLMLSYDATADRIDRDAVVEELLRQVAVAV
ncbi:MAG TPA: MoxR family ATPase [Acetobacteraceae bacterium]